jgi:Tol biopolymer transport system component
VKHTQITFSGDVLKAALSPDGATIAYVVGSNVADRRLLIRDVTGGAAVEVLRGLTMSSVGWMQDGRWVVVASRVSELGGKGFQALVVSRFGGTPRRIAGISEARVTVSPDRNQVAGASASSSNVRLMALDGGSVGSVRLAGLTSVWALQWSRSGRRLAVAGPTPELTWAVWVMNADGADLHRIYSGGPGTSLAEASEIDWSPSDDVAYVQWQAGGVSEVWRISGISKDAPVARPLLTGLVPSTFLTISGDGDRLAQVRTITTANLWRMDLAGSGIAPTPITQTSGALLRPHVSPDGQVIATVRGNEIVKVPIGGSDAVPIVRGSNGSWSPDGRHFAFVADRGQGPRVFVGDADGQQATEIKDAIPGHEDVLWLPDGRLAWLAGDSQNYLKNYGILDLASGRREFLIRKPVGWTVKALFSPKGDRVALEWNRPPAQGLWVVSGSERKERLLAAGLWPAGWSSDANWIYAYRLGSREILRVNAETGKVEAVGRFPAGALAWYSCDLTPDRRAIVCSLEDKKSDVWIVDHFDPQAAPAKK